MQTFVSKIILLQFAGSFHSVNVAVCTSRATQASKREMFRNFS